MSDRIRITGKKYYVDLHHDKYRGYFEHLVYGDEAGGGLWIETDENGQRTVYDFDGVYEIPKEVCALLAELGIKTDQVDV